MRSMRTSAKLRNDSSVRAPNVTAILAAISPALLLAGLRTQPTPPVLAQQDKAHHFFGSVIYLNTGGSCLHRFKQNPVHRDGAALPYFFSARTGLRYIQQPLKGGKLYIQCYKTSNFTSVAMKKSCSL